MPFLNRNKKRIFIFLLIPLLSAVQFFTEDIVLRIVAAVLLVVYVGFIIFLRDTVRQEEYSAESGFEDEDEYEQEGEYEGEPRSDFDTDYGEDFKIISKNKNIEASSYGDISGTGDRSAAGSYFKPPDLKETFEKIANEKLPENVSHDEHFGFILEKILSVVKESYMAHAALFFWYNKRKEMLALEKYVTNSGDIILQKFEVEDDVLSKIVKKEEPELLTDVLEKVEADVIRYYSKPQGIKSFIGVPLYYGDQLAGVLAIDSKIQDAFGIETIYSLGRFVRVISSIISLFDEKFADTQADQRLRSLLNVLSTDKKFETEQELYAAIENSVKSLINWDVFAFINYSPLDQKFKTSKITNKTSLKYVGENLEVELKGTLIGKTIVTGQPVKVDDTTLNETPRYARSEDVTFDGSFLAVPLIYDEQYYGVICFESLKKAVYNQSDIEFLKKATKIFAYLVYAYSTQSVLKSLLSLDVETKFLNKKSFLKNVRLELSKSAQLEIPGALVLIQIDNFLEENSLFEGDPFPKVVQSITEMIKEEVGEFHLLGRIDEKLFALYFFNTHSKEAFLWSEKLRTKIVRKPVEISTKQTTFTVSIGVANTTNKTNLEEVLYDAELALNKAVEKGGNQVKSI